MRNLYNDIHEINKPNAAISSNPTYYLCKSFHVLVTPLH